MRVSAGMKTLWLIAAAFYLALTAVTQAVLQPPENASPGARPSLFAKR